MYSVVLQKGHLDKSDTNIFSTGISGGGSRIFVEGGGPLSFKSDTNVCSIIIGISGGGSRIFMRGGSVVFKPDGYWVFMDRRPSLCI